MAKPNKKGPTKTVDIFCSGCNMQLLKYRKGGKGVLVKCFIERITKDFTTTACTCPKCEIVFARQQLIKGTPAFKIIGGKVWFK